MRALSSPDLDGMEMDWENLYQEGITPWDKGLPSPPLVDWLGKNADFRADRILVPGCGRGHDVKEIARHCSDSAITGLDISPSALEYARKESVADNVTYLEDDLFRLPSTEMAGSFHWVWEHTCYCAIEISLREAYVEAVHSLLAPGGEFLGIFYLDPYDDEHRPGGGPPHGTSEEDLVEKFEGSGRFRILERYVPDVSYPGREGLELMLRMVSVNSDQ